MNSIESMEKFFLGGIFTGQELDIVKEKGIDFTVFVFEFHGGFFSDGRNDFVGKVFTRTEKDFKTWVLVEDSMTDGLHKMRFTDPCAAPDE